MLVSTSAFFKTSADPTHLAFWLLNTAMLIAHFA